MTLQNFKAHVFQKWLLLYAPSQNPNEDLTSLKKRFGNVFSKHFSKVGVLDLGYNHLKSA
jgi:hypothetical protein